MSGIERQVQARRRRIAEEIRIVLDDLGLNRKQFAEKMGRQPSEVTRWLSGSHNFTSDLLEEISIALGRPISGAEDRFSHGAKGATTTKPTDTKVDGYAHKGALGTLCEPTCVVDFIDIPDSTARTLTRMARSDGKTLREFIRETLEKVAAEDAPHAADFCGIWSEGYPDADEIRAMRTTNRLPLL